MPKSNKQSNPVPISALNTPNRSEFTALWYIPLCLIILFFGYQHAFKLKWYGDDVFIMLRYIDNWLSGNGLVYNIGERVEGYTNFFWMALIALSQKLGFDALKSSLNLGISCYIIVLSLYGFLSYKIQNKRFGLVIPVTMIGLGLHHHFNAYATSGLETMLFTLLLSSIILVLFGLDWKPKSKLIVTGLLFVCLATTRPDGTIFIILFNFLLLSYYLIKKTGFRKIFLDGLWLNLPVVCFFLPFLLWRYNYYGSLVPNTYYAKAGNISQFEQGFTFIQQYFHVYWSSYLWIPLLLIYLYVVLKNNNPATPLMTALKQDKNLQLSLTALSIILLYGFGFIAKVGGDFMYSRFMIPLVPFFYLLVELSIIGIIENHKWNKAAKVALLVSSVLVFFWFNRIDKNNYTEFLTETLQDGRVIYKINDNIVDERLFYKDIIKKIEFWGRYLAPHFEGLPVVVLNSGQCAFTYYGKFHTIIEKFGLTDTTIAKQVVPKENLGRIGHSKPGSYEYFIKRGVHFSFYRSPYKNEEYRFANFILPDGSALRAEMFIFDKKIVYPLRNRFGNRFAFTDMEPYIESIIQKLPTLPMEKREAYYTEFKEYYFDPNTDARTKDQEKRFLEFLGSGTSQNE